MTAKQLFEYVLIELNKVQAPSLILEDYNYFINKGINQYINKMYNFYDLNQQKTDDLRVLKSTAALTPALNNEYTGLALLNKTYEVDLPDDYLHILNCVAEYTVAQNYKCYNAGSKLHFGAKRLTADMFSQIINNYYMRPSYKNPYFYINNVATEVAFPISEAPDLIVPNSALIGSISIYFNTVVTPAGVLRIIKNGIIYDFTYADPTTNSLTFNDRVSLQTALQSCGIASEFLDAKDLSIPNAGKLGITDASVTGNIISIGIAGIQDTSPLVDRYPGYRYGNRSKVRLELRYGKDNALFTLSKIYIDYLRAPQFIRLTQDQIDEVEDTSQLLEFPDYVNHEIVNEVIKLLMENASDPRLQTNIPINQSIATPQQEQAKKSR